MTYLDELADEIEQQIPPDLLPDKDTRLLFHLYALLALVKGTEVTAVDVHNAWAVWMEQGDPDHRSIKPFEELDTRTQSSDEPFAKAIRAVAKRLGLNPA
jgi:hypothetical protein